MSEPQELDAPNSDGIWFREGDVWMVDSAFRARRLMLDNNLQISYLTSVANLPRGNWHKAIPATEPLIDVEQTVNELIEAMQEAAGDEHFWRDRFTAILNRVPKHNACCDGKYGVHSKFCQREQGDTIPATGGPLIDVEQALDELEGERLLAVLIKDDCLLVGDNWEPMAKVRAREILSRCRIATEPQGKPLDEQERQELERRAHAAEAECERLKAELAKK